MSERIIPLKPRRRIGCWVMPAVLALACLGSGGWLLNQWNALPGVGRVAAVMLVVFGTLLLIPVLIWLAIVMTVRWFLGKVGRAIEQVVDQSRATYGKVHEFAPPRTEDWEKLDEEFYAAATETLRAAGFRHLGDIVDKTLAETVGYSTVIRIMVSHGGTTMVGFYDISAMPAIGDSIAHIFDLAMEFSDGSFLVTSNTGEVDLAAAIPGIERRQLPGQTDVLALLEAHEKEKESLIAARPDRHALVISTLSEALESEKRQQVKKNQFRKQAGAIQPGEVRRIAERAGHDTQTASSAVDALDAAKPKAAGGGGQTVGHGE